MRKDNEHGETKIIVNQTANTIQNSTGVNINPPSKKQPWYFNPYLVAVVCGLIVWFIINKTETMGKDNKKKVDEIKIEQKGDILRNVVGVDLSNNPQDVELGKVDVKQEGKVLLNNVTGLKMKFDNNSGEVKATDKIRIIQDSPGGRSEVEINAHLPGTEVIFNKKTEKSETE